jgi:hypothetical protein
MTAMERTPRLPWAGPAVERRRDAENAGDVVPRGLRVAAALGWRLLVVTQDPQDETGREVMRVSNVVDEAHDDLRVGPISAAK